jgi:hypothetical protein
VERELKEVVDRINTELDERRKMQGAIEQIEKQVAAMPATIETKLSAIKAASWDNRGDYRGVFANEEDAVANCRKPSSKRPSRLRPSKTTRRSAAW